MKLALISGSQQTPSNSWKVTQYLAEQAQAKGAFTSLYCLDLQTLNLPLRNSAFPDGDGWQDWPALREALTQADALVLVTPEWNGMVTPMMKNFLMLCSAHELGHKPGLAVTVSAGINGAYPIAELRAHALKNNQLVLIPQHLIIRSANEVLNPQAQSAHDGHIKTRIDNALDVLALYAQALSPMRQQHNSTLTQFGNGL